jgi:phosphatidylglycerophosphatase A
MKIDIIKILATFFGVGYLPYFPGTWASMVGVGIYFLLRNNFTIYISLTVVIFLLGFLVALRAEQRFAQKDSRFIVIDELAAILILLALIPSETFIIFLAFIIFRIFDIIKPYPIKKIENFSGSWGIMLDDIVAAFYTLILIKIFK